MSDSYTLTEVAKHNNPESLFIVIDNGVYDVTKFADEHPGGKKILVRACGKDSSKQFWKYHNGGVLAKYGAKLKIGEVKEEAKL